MRRTDSERKGPFAALLNTNERFGLLARFRSTRYANVAATLALLFSLAGTGTAASFTVATLTGKDVKDGSLTLRDLSPAALKTLAYKNGGSDKKIATSLKLAGYVNTSPQTLPDDSSFHSIWSISFKVSQKQLFILTGNFGSATTPGCSGGDYQYSERVLLDGTNTGAPPEGFLTFTPGNHTLTYEIRGDCPGSPVNVQSQQILMLPFTLP
jgi:hypothetical protein